MSSSKKCNRNGKKSFPLFQSSCKPISVDGFCPEPASQTTIREICPDLRKKSLVNKFPDGTRTKRSSAKKFRPRHEHMLKSPFTWMQKEVVFVPRSDRSMMTGRANQHFTTTAHFLSIWAECVDRVACRHYNLLSVSGAKSDAKPYCHVVQSYFRK